MGRYISTKAGDDRRGAEADRVRSLKPLRRLVPFIVRYPVRLALTLLFLLVAAVTSLAIPALLGQTIDEGFLTQNLEVVSRFGFLVIGVAALMAVASGARFYFIAVIGERVLTDLRRAVFDHLLTLDATFFDTHRVGELTSRLNGDVAVIRTAVGSSLSLTLRSVVIIAGALIMMVLTSPSLTMGVVIVVPAIIVPTILYARRLRRMSRLTQDALADLSAMATEVLSATKTIKAFVQEKTQSRLFAVGAEASYGAEVRRLLARAILVSMVMFLGTSGLVALIWWGARSVFEGSVTVGELSQFIIYAMMASGALANVSEMLGIVQSVAGATERLVEILDTEPGLKAPASPVALPQPPLGTVRFENAGFSYMTRDRETVLEDVSFSVAQGETVALVGPSGAGKSTVFSLLQRFYDVSEGRILVDGIDVRQTEMAGLRKRFAYVEQDSVLFAGTVADNIRFGRSEASDAEIEAAARAARVHEFVSTFDKGYDSLIGERGVMLSGGQKQRLAIARALLRDAPILLLDEATSALDSQSEQKVQQALDRLIEGRTTLVIAHRLATIRNADRILVLDGGRLAGEGNHEDLVAAGGRYAELARLQFGDDQWVRD